jgi:hypothetical protein
MLCVVRTRAGYTIGACFVMSSDEWRWVVVQGGDAEERRLPRICTYGERGWEFEGF